MADQLERIAIGERLERSHEVEGARFRWANDSCELVISLGNPRPKEIRGIEHEVFEFGLNVVESMPFVCFRVFEVIGTKGFGQPQKAKLVRPWQECPFHLSRFDPGITSV
jgi:hypothetical protein